MMTFHPHMHFYHLLPEINYLQIFSVYLYTINNIVKISHSHVISCVLPFMESAYTWQTTYLQ